MSSIVIAGNTSGSVTLQAPDVAGTTTINLPAESGTALYINGSNRITGDFSNSTVADRVLFQSSTTNGVSAIGAIPNGTGVSASFIAFSSPDANNSSFIGIYSSATDVALISSKTGTGTFLPMTFYASGSEQMRIDTDGTITGTKGNLQLITGTAQATTSGTVKDFTGIPPWVKRITVMFNGVSSSGTSQIQIQLGDSGGFETTGYISMASTPANAYNSTTGLVVFGVTATDVRYGTVVINNFGNNTWVSTGIISTGIAAGSQSSCTGVKTVTSTLDRIRITTVNGTDTFDAGSVNIMYE